MSGGSLQVLPGSIVFYIIACCIGLLLVIWRYGIVAAKEHFIKVTVEVILVAIVTWIPFFVWQFIKAPYTLQSETANQDKEDKEKSEAFQKELTEKKNEIDEKEKRIKDMEKIQDNLTVQLRTPIKNTKFKVRDFCFKQSMEFEEKDVDIKSEYFYNKEVTIHAKETINEASRIRIYADHPIYIRTIGGAFNAEKPEIFDDRGLYGYEFTVRVPITKENGIKFILYADYKFKVFCIDRKGL